MQLSQAQVSVLRHAFSDDTTLLAGGAVRSGKSFAVLTSFAVYLANLPTGHDHAIVGQSIEAIMRNMGFDFMEAIDRIEGASVTLDRTFGTRLLVRGRAQQNVWIIGANDAKARRRIQGSTLKSLVVEELALLPEDFFFMAWSRLSEANAKLWASYNPEGPSHWAKRKVVDEPGQFGAKVLRFTMRDNPTLSDEVIARYERSFTGHFYRRYIAGEWAAAEGACYARWETTTDEGRGQPALALDWAVSGTLCVLAIRGGVVFDELYHEGRTDGLLEESEVAHRMSQWAMVRDIGPCFVWLDPATPATFKRRLRLAGWRVRSADNDVIPGIVTTANRLASGDIKIHERCVKLQEELAGYVWDAAAAELGEDKPLKKADHGPDALRYFAHSTGKAARAMRPTPVREALR